MLKNFPLGSLFLSLGVFTELAYAQSPSLRSVIPESAFSTMNLRTQSESPNRSAIEVAPTAVGLCEAYLKIEQQQSSAEVSAKKTRCLIWAAGYLQSIAKRPTGQAESTRSLQEHCAMMPFDHDGKVVPSQSNISRNMRIDKCIKNERNHFQSTKRSAAREDSVGVNESLNFASLCESNLAGFATRTSLQRCIDWYEKKERLRQSNELPREYPVLKLNPSKPN